ncbi:MAG: hypothetical protein ABL977_11845 [Candidatus Eisenbacteria bacterium]
MRRLSLSMCSLLLVAAMVQAAPSTDSPREARTSVPTTAPVVAPTTTELKALATARADRKAMQAELKQNAERAKAAVADLEARHAATSDAATRALIQRHIEAAKREADVEFFRIQLRHAQAMGRAADVSALQGVIDARLRQPAPALAPLPPVERKSAPALSVQAKKESGK